MDKHLILLRGIPGAGKSTVAKVIEGSHIEADAYFINENGEYCFDATKLKDAHEWCRATTEIAMKRGAYKVIVSNTFTQEWEMKPYYDLAEKYKFKVFSLVVENRHNGKNTHGVPESKIDEMKKRFKISL